VPVLFNIYPHRHFTASEARCHALQGLANGPTEFLERRRHDARVRLHAALRDYLDFGTAVPVKFLALRGTFTSRIPSAARQPRPA